MTDPIWNEACRRMTREQATDLVEDLLQAAHDYEIHGYRYTFGMYYREMKERVITALVDGP